MEFFLFIAFMPLILGFIAYVGSFLHKRYQQFAPRIEKMDSVIEEHLKNNHYYNKLSDKGKQEFIRRTRYFCLNKRFMGKSGLEVTDEMRVQISAAVTQVTFGYKNYKPSNIGQVWIYPKSFYNRRKKRMLKGFATRGGIGVSWPDFQEGYANPSDRYNLGLHEVAHALHIASFRNDDLKGLKAHFEDWEKLGKEHMDDVRKGEGEFLRAYAGENKHEFFAVTVEHFFEAPKAFKTMLPELYEATCKLLCQDPLRPQFDYQLDSSVEPMPTSYVSEVEWDSALIFVGAFVGIPLVNFLSDNLVINFGQLFLAAILLSLLGVIFFSWFQKRGFYSYSLIYGLFCFFGLGVNMLSILLMLNMYLPAGSEYYEVYPILKAKGQGSERVVELEGGAYQSYKHIRCVDNYYHRKGNRIVIYFRKGIFQIPERTGYEIIRPEQF